MRYNLVLTLWLRASLGSAYARGKLMALQRRQKEQKHIRIHMLNEQRWCFISFSKILQQLHYCSARITIFLPISTSIDLLVRVISVFDAHEHLHYLYA